MLQNNQVVFQSAILVYYPASFECVSKFQRLALPDFAKIYVQVQLCYMRWIRDVSRNTLFYVWFDIIIIALLKLMLINIQSYYEDYFLNTSLEIIRKIIFQIYAINVSNKMHVFISYRERMKYFHFF